MIDAVSKPKILIIDDESTNIEILQNMLEAEYNILFATNGFDGIQIATNDTLPDLILLDIVMPGMDGYEVCQKLKENDRAKNIPVIFITVKGEEEYETRGFAVGAVDYIAKPFSPIIAKCRVKAHVSLKLAMEKVNLQNIELLEAHTDLEKKVTAKTIDLERTNRCLRESEEKYRLLFDNAAEAIFVAQDGKVVFFNQMAVTLFGHSADVISSSPLIDFVHPDDRGMVMDGHVKRMNGESATYNYFFRIIHKDGGIRWVNLHSILIDWNGRKAGLTFVTDYTERKMAELKIQEAKERFEALFNMSPLSSVLLRAGDSVVIDVNEAFTATTGFSRDEVIGKTSIELGIYDNLADREMLNRELMDNGFGSNKEIIFRMKNGNKMTCLVFAKIVKLMDVPHVLVVSSDISDKKRTEEELKHYAAELEEANTALRVVMGRQNEDQKILEERLQQNISELVIPYIKKLKSADLDDRLMNYLDVLANNLDNIVSPFLATLSSRYKNLTPQETQVADLIRQGKNTKEIADTLCASVHTISTHRNNIRDKLKLRNSKTNLRSYLLSLK